MLKYAKSEYDESKDKVWWPVSEKLVFNPKKKVMVKTTIKELLTKAQVEDITGKEWQVIQLEKDYRTIIHGPSDGL